eukprot:11205375-Lingulodinium_polyedra.AAC.1
MRPRRRPPRSRWNARAGARGRRRSTWYVNGNTRGCELWLRWPRPRPRGCGGCAPQTPRNAAPLPAPGAPPADIG